MLGVAKTVLVDMLGIHLDWFDYRVDLTSEDSGWIFPTDLPDWTYWHKGEKELKEKRLFKAETLLFDVLPSIYLMGSIISPENRNTVNMVFICLLLCISIVLPNILLRKLYKSGGVTPYTNKNLRSNQSLANFLVDVFIMCITCVATRYLYNILLYRIGVFIIEVLLSLFISYIIEYFLRYIYFVKIKNNY